MPLMLDVSDEVRAEIGDDEANRLIAGENTPASYDCTSCRGPGDITRERTSTVLFVGGDTAVLAFAHANCVPSQVVAVSEEQLRGAVHNLTRGAAPAPPEAPAASSPAPGGPAASSVPEPAREPAGSFAPSGPADHAEAEPAVLGITCGLVLCDGTPLPALVVEPTGPVARPGSTSGGDEFLQMLLDEGFTPIHDMDQPPHELPGWSVLLAAGRLHAVLYPGPGGAPAAWWQAHQPLSVTDSWRSTAARGGRVLVYAAPVGSIGHQPREDLLRQALEKAAGEGVLVGAVLPLAGT